MNNENKKLIEFLEDGDILTLHSDDRKFIFNKSKMIFEDEPDTQFPIELKNLKLHMIVDIERKLSVFEQLKKDINGK